MNCYIVVLRCGVDDLIVGVRDTRDSAFNLASIVASDPVPFLEAANKLYRLDASEIMALSLVTVRIGHVTEVEDVPFPEDSEFAKESDLAY